MSDPIYFPSGAIEQTWGLEDESHAENQVTVKDLGGFMWGPLEECLKVKAEAWGKHDE